MNPIYGDHFRWVRHIKRSQKHGFQLTAIKFLMNIYTCHTVHKIDYIFYMRKDKTPFFIHFPKLLSQAKELNFQWAISQNSIFTDIAYRQTLELDEKLTQGIIFSQPLQNYIL